MCRRCNHRPASPETHPAGERRLTMLRVTDATLPQQEHLPQAADLRNRQPRSQSSTGTACRQAQLRQGYAGRPAHRQYCSGQGSEVVRASTRLRSFHRDYAQYPPLRQVCASRAVSDLVQAPEQVCHEHSAAHSCRGCTVRASSVIAGYPPGDCGSPAARRSSAAAARGPPADPAAEAPTTR